MKQTSSLERSRDKVPERSRLLPDGTAKCWLHYCELNHEFRSRSKHSGVCPYCTNRKLLKGFNDLKTVQPELAKEMDAADNSIQSDEIIYGSNRKVSWKSSICGHSWNNMSPASRVRENQGCPFEAGKRDSSGAKKKPMSIAERYPELIARGWDWMKNTDDPANLRLTHNSYWWTCLKSHSYARSIYNEKNYECPVCSGHKVDPETRSFWSECQKTGRTDLLEQWSEDNELSPKDYAPKSQAKAYWKCTFGHKWIATISSRWSRGCPSCSRKRIEVGYNDLLSGVRASEMDYLIEEWDLDANGLMENYSFKSPSKAYWICRFNPEHRWKAIISNRTTGNGCRQCRVSKFEIDLREFIEELVGNSAVRNDRIILQGKELDIYFPDLAIAVEANGDYWHSNAVIYNQKGITSYKYHLDKLNKAALKGVRLIFVWESDWYENANAVRKAIQLFLQDPSDIDPLLSILSKEKS